MSTHVKGVTQPNPHTLTPSVIRDAMLKAAGITPEVQARLLRRAVSKVHSKLKAQKPHVTVVQDGQGRSHKEITYHDDNMAQLRAAETLIRLTGAEPSKDVNSSPVKVQVEVKLPDWGKPPVVEVKGEILETEVSSPKTIDITPTSE